MQHYRHWRYFKFLAAIIHLYELQFEFTERDGRFNILNEVCPFMCMYIL